MLSEGCSNKYVWIGFFVIIMLILVVELHLAGTDREMEERENGHYLHQLNGLCLCLCVYEFVFIVFVHVGACVCVHACACVWVGVSLAYGGLFVCMFACAGAVHVCMCHSAGATLQRCSKK